MCNDIGVLPLYNILYRDEKKGYGSVGAGAEVPLSFLPRIGERTSSAKMYRYE
jgi:hypothetical protein